MLIYNIRNIKVEVKLYRGRKKMNGRWKKRKLKKMRAWMCQREYPQSTLDTLENVFCHEEIAM